MATKYFLSDFPAPEELQKIVNRNHLPEFREVNSHIHTPYSFSAFNNMSTIFSTAKEEEISVLGINDFFVTDGYQDFSDNALKYNIFPLFNIEFIGLLKDEQRQGIRINDPNNPGRIYFTGKGLDFPFSLGFLEKMRLKTLIRETQFQMKAMISKLNKLIEPINPAIILSYEDIKECYARDLVRERHLAKALKDEAEKHYPDIDERQQFLELLYGGRKSNAGPENIALLENEIRANLLKSGGAAFVEENEDSFLKLSKIIRIILKAGGIPCYPVLLDDTAGNFTEFEADYNKLFNTLSSFKIGCIELIPGRNSYSNLVKFVKFFHDKEFLILFGTEHNTPEMIPLTVSAGKSEKIDTELKKIVWENTCVIAAHQYLRAQGMQGYILHDGTPSFGQKRELAFLGKLVIEYFLLNNNKSNET